MEQHPQSKSWKIIKKVGLILSSVILLINVVAYNQAYHLTHFSEDTTLKRQNPYEQNWWERSKHILLGIQQPKPQTTLTPQVPFESITLKSDLNLSAWWIPVEASKGTVIVFHGYGGTKSSLIAPSSIFNTLGYNTLLVDFRGHGASDGNITTLGVQEAKDVSLAFEWVKQYSPTTKIILFGTSMGAVAILKAMEQDTLQASGLILECPFGSMEQAVKSRFNLLNIPTFPMADALLFWGGWQHGFNAFEHQPSVYAKKVHCPTLLLYGEQDPKVSRLEIDAIYNELQGIKSLKTYPKAGHDNFLKTEAEQWNNDVKEFLEH
jgi:alpha-beta hydrolase superfamily lysophospholipase